MCVCGGKLESVRQCFPISDFRFLLLFSVFFLFGAIRAERVSTLTYELLAIFVTGYEN